MSWQNGSSIILSPLRCKSISMSIFNKPQQSTMSRIASRRLLAQSPQSLISEITLSKQPSLQCLRSFSQTSRRRDDEDAPPLPKETRAFPSASSPPSPVERFNYGQNPVSPSLNPKASAESMRPLANFAAMMDKNNMDRANSTRSPWANNNLSADGSLFGNAAESRPPHQLHVYASRHNCHITLWGPPKSVRINKKKDKESFKGGALMSISAGNIGFKHSGRKHYDSAFQLASYVFVRMAEAGVSQDIEKLELYLRGFGAGREAVTKALLGAEGKLLRNKVVKVADTTKLKFGGTRSPNPRRL